MSLYSTLTDPFLAFLSNITNQPKYSDSFGFCVSKYNLFKYLCNSKINPGKAQKTRPLESLTKSLLTRIPGEKHLFRRTKKTFNLKESYKSSLKETDFSRIPPNPSNIR